MERGEVVKGVPVVEPGDNLFWFNRPQLILYLINFVLFQVFPYLLITSFHSLPNQHICDFTQYIFFLFHFTIAECLSACFPSMDLGKFLFNIKLKMTVKGLKLMKLLFFFQFEFGLKSCFLENTEDVVIRVTMGYLIFTNQRSSYRLILLIFTKFVVNFSGLSFKFFAAMLLSLYMPL